MWQETSLHMRLLRVELDVGIMETKGIVQQTAVSLW